MRLLARGSLPANNGKDSLADPRIWRTLIVLWPHMFRTHRDSEKPIARKRDAGLGGDDVK